MRNPYQDRMSLPKVRLAVALACLGLVSAVLASPLLSADTDITQIKQLIEAEQRESIGAIVVPTTTRLSAAEFGTLMQVRGQHLARYYTGRALDSIRIRWGLTADLPAYPPEKLMAAASDGVTPPALPKPNEVSQLEPDIQPVASAITSIKYDSVEVIGDFARVIADVESWTDFLEKGAPGTTAATHRYTYSNLFTFTLVRANGQWLIEVEQVQDEPTPGQPQPGQG